MLIETEEKDFTEDQRCTTSAETGVCMSGEIFKVRFREVIEKQGWQSLYSTV